MQIREQLAAAARTALQRLPGGRMVWRGPASVRRVALTFDDGPLASTPGLLDVLDRCGAPATFFCTGDMSEERRPLIADYLRRGHQVGGHGYNHRKLTTLSQRELVDQLRRTARAIGPVPQGRLWVRPPYGEMDARVLATLLAEGHVVAMWSFDSHDYQLDDPDQLVARCAPRNIRNGDVILFHEGHEWTAAALPRIVANLVGAGYELVTMADLVAR